MAGVRGTVADVVVVGAGPAGSSTALLLARQGLEVVVIDRDTFPRAKACGDCLSAGATALLDRLGLLAAIESAGPARLRGWDIVAPSGRAVTGTFPGTAALALERSVFDDRLLDAARQAGARFVRGRVRELLRDGATGRVVGVAGRDVGGGPLALRARLVVGAGGLRSVVSRRLGLVRRRPRLRKVSLTTHVTLDGGTPDRGEMHLVDGGCVGLAPVGRGRYNLTIVATGRHGEPLRTLGPEAFMRRWVARAPRLRDRLEGFHPDGFLASGPFDYPVRAATGHGAALVGDAAGYYDPFTGQGIYQAMAGAELLAGAVAPALAGGDLDGALQAYARAHRRLVGPTRRVQRAIEAALAGTRRAEAVLGGLARAPLVMDRLIAVTGDLEPPRSLLSPSLLSTLVRPSPAETR